VELDVGRDLVEIRRAGDLLTLQGVRTQRGHGHGCVLQAFSASARRHDDGFDGLGFLRARFGRSLRG
jgi:hypothetical protein